MSFSVQSVESEGIGTDRYRLARSEFGNRYACTLLRIIYDLVIETVDFQFPAVSFRECRKLGRIVEVIDVRLDASCLFAAECVDFAAQYGQEARHEIFVRCRYPSADDDETVYERRCGRHCVACGSTYF